MYILAYGNDDIVLEHEAKITVWESDINFFVLGISIMDLLQSGFVFFNIYAQLHERFLNMPPADQPYQPEIPGESCALPAEVDFAHFLWYELRYSTKIVHIPNLDTLWAPRAWEVLAKGDGDQCSQGVVDDKNGLKVL